MKKVEKQAPKVDVYNDEEMVSLGIRPAKSVGRDPKIWSKIYTEKQDAKLVKKYLKHAFESSNWPAPKKSIPVPGKLIVTIKPSEKFMEYNRKGKKTIKTVYSHSCMQHDIPNILDKYFDIQNKKRVSLVIKYSWNGKTYSEGVLPYSI